MERNRVKKIIAGLFVSGGLLLGAGYGDVFDQNKQPLVVNASSLELENPNVGVLYDIRQRNIENFTYKKDEVNEWSVSESGEVKFEGDCEDFALAVARDIFEYNKINGDVFRVGLLITRSQARKIKAHAGLIILDRENSAYYLTDNGPYEYRGQKGLIYIGKGDRAPYEDLESLTVNGKSIIDAYLLSLTTDPRDIDLHVLSKSAYWNQVYKNH